jgi:hypothetical protein
MNETWQTVIVVVLVALSIGLAARHFYRLYTQKQDCCEGCDCCCEKCNLKK